MITIAAVKTLGEEDNLEAALKVCDASVPGLVLLVAISATGLWGGASILVALVSLGPGGVLGGIATLGVIGYISKGISDYGFEEIFIRVVRELKRSGETHSTILGKIEDYPISSSLKLTLKGYLSELS